MLSVELTPEQRLTAFEREIHSREWGYVLIDRLHNYCVLTQRLPEVHRFLSQYVDPDDPPSLASLYESATAKLRNGYVHRRWRVIRSELPECADEFERRRCGCAHSIVLGQPRHLKVTTVI